MANLKSFNHPARIPVKRLEGDIEPDINESDTWITDAKVDDQERLSKSVEHFYNQISRIKLKLTQLTTESKNIEEKLQIIQGMSTHLSFHLGEMILQLRQNGDYPMPGDMKLFLTSETDETDSF